MFTPLARKWLPILALATMLHVTPGHAARVIEVSKDLSFGAPVMNSSGSVAYFAYTDDFGDDDSLDGLQLKRDGSQVLANFSNYLLVDSLSSLDLSDNGLLAFVAAHVVGGQVIGGVFRGASPGQPTQDQFGHYLAVFMRGGTVAASPRGTFVDLDTAEDQISCGDIKLTANRLLACEKRINLGASKLYDEGRGAGGRGKLSENGRIAVHQFDVQAMAPQFQLFRFNMDPEVLRLEEVREYRDAIGNQFAGQTIRNWLVANNGSTAVLTTPDNDSSRTDLYRISVAGGVTSIAQDIDAFNILGVSNSGTVIYHGRGLRSSDNPDEQWVSVGDAIEDYVITSLSGFGSNGYSNGKLAVSAFLCRLDDRSDCYSAVIVVDGSTSAAPPPPSDPNNPPPDLVLWKAAGNASFNDPDSWDPATVPDSDQVALFAGSNDLKDVAFGNFSANTRQLRIEQGTVNFHGGSYQLNQGSVATPSFLIEASAPGDIPVLNIDGGHQFSTTNATLRNLTSDPNFPASIFLEDGPDDPPVRSRWDNQGRLTVDGQLYIARSGGLVSDSLFIASQPGSRGLVAAGTLRGCPDISIADFGETWVGYRGVGRLEISGDSCAVELSDNVVVGAQVGASGTVEVNGTSWIPFFSAIPSTDVPTVTIGSAGSGIVNVVAGGAMAAGDLYIGQQTSGSGELNLSGFVPALGARSIVEAFELLEVGGNGRGTLRVSDGARLTAGELDVGGVTGQVFVSGPPDPSINVGTLDVAGRITVGRSGQGFAEFSDLALVQSNSGALGEDPGSIGRVTIRDGASWAMTGDLQVGNVNDGVNPNACVGVDLGLARGELNLQGDGVLFDVTGQTLTVVGPDSRLTGTGKLVFANTLLSNCATLAPGNSPGTLTIEGNLMINGGALEIELDGLAHGEFDQLDVEGDVDLRGANVTFSFGRHVPTQGDQVRFLTSSGVIITDATTRYDYVGAEPGFEFQIDPDGTDGLRFTALNDAFRDEVFSNSFE